MTAGYTSLTVLIRQDADITAERSWSFHTECASGDREGRQFRRGDGADEFCIRLPASAAGWVADLPRSPRSFLSWRAEWGGRGCTDPPENRLQIARPQKDTRSGTWQLRPHARSSMSRMATPAAVMTLPRPRQGRISASVIGSACTSGSMVSGASASQSWSPPRM